MKASVGNVRVRRLSVLLIVLVIAGVALGNRPIVDELIVGPTELDKLKSGNAQIKSENGQLTKRNAELESKLKAAEKAFEDYKNNQKNHRVVVINNHSAVKRLDMLVAVIVEPDGSLKIRSVLDGYSGSGQSHYKSGWNLDKTETKIFVSSSDFWDGHAAAVFAHAAGAGYCWDTDNGRLVLP